MNSSRFMPRCRWAGPAAAGGSSLLLEHDPPGVTSIFFQLPEGFTLAEDAWHLAQPTYIYSKVDFSVIFSLAPYQRLPTSRYPNPAGLAKEAARDHRSRTPAGDGTSHADTPTRAFGDSPLDRGMPFKRLPAPGEFMLPLRLPGEGPGRAVVGAGRRARLAGGERWRASPQPTSGFRTDTPGKRPKSRSTVQSSRTPWRRQIAATRASCTCGPATLPSRRAARSSGQ
jgi:hypothetical protein